MSKSLRYSNITNDETLSNEEKTMIPSEFAVKNYVDNKVKKIKVPRNSKNESNIKKLKVEIKDIPSKIYEGKKGEVCFGEQGVYICVQDNNWEKIEYDSWEKFTIVSGD